MSKQKVLLHKGHYQRINSDMYKSGLLLEKCTAMEATRLPLEEARVLAKYMDVEISDPLDRFGIFVDVGKPSDSDYAQLQLYSQVTKKEQGANDHLGVSFLPTHLVMKLCFAASDIPNYKLVLFPTKYDAEEYLSLIKDFMNFEDPSYSNYFANAYCAQV